MGRQFRENQRPMSQGEHGTVVFHLSVHLVQDDFLPYC